MPANEGGPRLQALERMLQVTMTDGSGSDHERTISNSFRYGFEFFGIDQYIRGSHGRTRILKRHIIGIYDSQVEKSKVAHGPSGRADVERIARVYQDQAQVIEFSRNVQVMYILRHASRAHITPLIASRSRSARCKSFAVSSLFWGLQM